MKNILSAISFILLMGNSLFAQKDSGFLEHVAIKTNPMFIIGNFIRVEGEWGGIIQVPLIKTSSPNAYYKVDAFIGAGYNRFYTPTLPDFPSYASGYTIRGGLYYFFTKRRKGYLQLEYYFREWSFTNAIDYPLGANIVLDPTSIIGSQGSTPDYGYNATVNMVCFDVIYGNIVPIHHSKHFILEWYAGLGWRSKSIQESKIGDYQNNQYIPRLKPFPFPEEDDTYPDIKLGCLIGFIL